MTNEPTIEQLLRRNADILMRNQEVKNILNEALNIIKSKNYINSKPKLKRILQSAVDDLEGVND